MSVYTNVSQDELHAFLRCYDLGHLEHYQGISAGIENTNFFVTTSQGRFVLTLFEQLDWDDLPYFLNLMAFLSEHGVPSAHPLVDRQGHYLRTLNGRPAALVRRLEGHDVTHPNLEQCAALGAALGHLHTVGQHFAHYRASQRGSAWRYAIAAQVLPKLAPQQAELVRAELDYLQQTPLGDLPQGVTHADLFRDNALFQDNQLMGIIDFYYACNDTLLYDIAITVNDWCSTAQGSLDHARLESFISAYHAQRPLSAVERASWSYMLRAAAMRFWLSRLQDYHFPRAGEVTHIKNPKVFEDIVRHRATQTVPLPLG